MSTDSHESALSDELSGDQCVEIGKVMRSAKKALGVETAISHELGEKGVLEDKRMTHDQEAMIMAVEPDNDGTVEEDVAVSGMEYIGSEVELEGKSAENQKVTEQTTAKERKVVDGRKKKQVPRGAVREEEIVEGSVVEIEEAVRIESVVNKAKMVEADAPASNEGVLCNERLSREEKIVEEEKPVEGEQMTTEEEAADLGVAVRKDGIKEMIETGGSPMNDDKSLGPKETTGEGLPVEDEKTTGVDRRATDAKIIDKGADSGGETLEGEKPSTPPGRVLRKRPTVSPFQSESPANKRKRGSVDSSESDGDEDEDYGPDDHSTSEDEYVPRSDRADPPSPAPRKREERKRVKKSRRRPYTCGICGNGFTQKCHLKLHIASVHEGKKPYKCSFCDRRFTQLSHVRVHKCIVDQGSRKYTCDICGKKFFDPTGFRRHKALIHEGQRPFSCDQCEATFKENRALTQHKIVFHGGTSAFYCDCCGRYFGRSADLKQHRGRVHEESKTVICQICGYRFEREVHLHVHLSNVHKNDLPCVCEICKKGFLLVNDLRRHIRKVHKLAICKESQDSNDEKNLAARSPSRSQLPRQERGAFACGKCSCCFDMEDDLAAHSSQIHKDHPSCEPAVKSSSPPDPVLQSDATPAVCADVDMETMVREHAPTALSPLLTRPSESVGSCNKGMETFACTECNRSFKTKAALGAHFSKNHSGPGAYNCRKCSCCFDTNEDLAAHSLLVHKDEKPHMCGVCGRRYDPSSRKGKPSKNCDTQKKLGTTESSPISAPPNVPSLKNSIDRLPYVCDVCGTRFPLYSKLRAHSRTHKVKPTPAPPAFTPNDAEGRPAENPVPIITIKSEDETDVRTGHVLSGLADSHSRRSTENQNNSGMKNRNTPPVRRSVPAIFASAAKVGSTLRKPNAPTPTVRGAKNRHKDNTLPMVTIKTEDETDVRTRHAVGVPTNSPSRRLAENQKKSKTKNRKTPSVRRSVPVTLASAPAPGNNETSQSGVRSAELSASPIGAALQSVFSNIFPARNPKTNSTFSSHSAKPAKREDVAIRPGADETSAWRAPQGFRCYKCDKFFERADGLSEHMAVTHQIPTPASRTSQSTIRSSPKRIKREPSGC
ncbi:unnamed protein product [Calicophoron daubneyi]|uniref:C2H2-type domain-containing protein n=1 Tax=Calicophoron daubneyi TaxID=300641 RepID=A0AAV2TDP2_CALDB